MQARLRQDVQIPLHVLENNRYSDCEGHEGCSMDMVLLAMLAVVVKVVVVYEVKSPEKH